MTELDEAGPGMEIAQAVPTPHDSQQPQETLTTHRTKKTVENAAVFALLVCTSCPRG